MMKKIKENKAFVIIGTLVFLSMFVLNFTTPMVYDDYTYTRSFATWERITSFKEIFPSLYAHYFVMNGRIISHFFAQVVLFLPRHIFIVLNSAMYVAMGYLVYKHITGTKRKSPVLFCLVFIMMWFYIPAFGDTVIWIDGACNYLWTGVLVFLVLLPFRLYLDDNSIMQSKKWIFIMLIAGFIMGWCNENTSAAAIMSVVLFAVLYKINKMKIPAWLYTGFIGSVITFIVMITAPSNAARKEHFESSGIIKDLIYRFKDITTKLIEGPYAVFIVIMIFVFVYLLFKLKTWKNLMLPAIYALLFFASAHAMIASPYFPERAMFGGVLSLMISIGMLAHQIPVKKDFAVTMALIAVTIVLYCVEYAYVFYYDVSIMLQEKRRTEYILSEKEKGNLDIVVEPIPAAGDKNAWADLKTDPDHWVNEVTALYFEVDSIRVEE